VVQIVPARVQNETGASHPTETLNPKP